MTAYNVYQKDVKILENANIDQVNERTGIDSKRISHYINTGKTYHGKKGEFTFDYSDNEINRNVNPEFKKKWEDIRKAADLIRNGGKIVFIYGKPHHVEAVR